MRVLEALSAALSLTSAGIIISILGGGDKQLLFLAAFCCFLVAAYQVVNFYLGYKLQQRVEESRADVTDELKGEARKKVRALSPGEPTTVFGGHSVVENTTELLEPLPREAKRDS